MRSVRRSSPLIAIALPTTTAHREYRRRAGDDVTLLLVDAFARCRIRVRENVIYQVSLLFAGVLYGKSSKYAATGPRRTRETPTALRPSPYTNGGVV